MNTTHGIKEDNSIIVKKLLVTMGHFSDKMLNIKIYSLMTMVNLNKIGIKYVSVFRGQ